MKCVCFWNNLWAATHFVRVESLLSEDICNNGSFYIVKKFIFQIQCILSEILLVLFHYSSNFKTNTDNKCSDNKHGTAKKWLSKAVNGLRHVKKFKKQQQSSACHVRQLSTTFVKGNKPTLPYKFHKEINQ